VPFDEGGHVVFQVVEIVGVHCEAAGCLLPAAGKS
jgi:hypothetical protein